MREFEDVCLRLGMNKYFDYKNDEMFWEALSSDSKTMYFTFKGYDFSVAKFVDNKSYDWHNGLYKVIEQQTPENLKEQINLSFNIFLPLQKRMKNVFLFWKDCLNVWKM